MKSAHLGEMVRGWFIGGFTPAAWPSAACEVAVKRYVAGDQESLHHHRSATEVTLVVSGEVEMLGRRWTTDDIVVIEPNEATAFRAITDAVCIVVKLPGVMDDKFPGPSPA